MIRSSIRLSLWKWFTLALLNLLPFISISQVGHFLENSGQILDENQQKRDEVKFVLPLKDLAVFFTTNGPVYYFQKNHTSMYSKIKTGEIANPYSQQDWEQIEFQYATTDISSDFFFKDRKDGFRIDVQFQYANLTDVVGEHKMLVNTDFYWDADVKGKRGVASYERIRYRNVYPGIDLIYFLNNGKLQYDFEVASNANVQVISFNYRGALSQQVLENGDLLITTGVGEMVESAPKSYQNGQLITSSFEISDGVKFKLGTDYNPNLPLRIDPTVTWATMVTDNTGSSYFVTSHPQWDSQGNMYVNFSTYNRLTYPTVTPGGNAYHQNVSNSTTGLDYIIQKFNANRQIVWCTYFGGNGGAHVGFGNKMIAVDRNDQILIVGRITNNMSPHTFPLLDAGNGAYYESAVGNAKSFIARFSATGQLVWSTMLASTAASGTSGNSNGLQTISIDNNNNVFVAGYCYAGTWAEMPTVNPGNGAYFKTKAQTVESQAPIMFKFSPANVMLWGTYISQGLAGQYHGSGEPGHVIDIDRNNNVFSAFQVSTTSTAGATWGTVNPGGGAYIDGNMSSANSTQRKTGILKFNSSLALVWSTLYGGNTAVSTQTSNGWSDPGAIKVLHNDDILITGFTQCTSFPTVDLGGGAYYQTTKAVSTSNFSKEGMILRFSNGGVVKWATLHGPGGNVNIGASDGGFIKGIGVDAANNIYLSGWHTRDSQHPTQINTGSYNYATSSEAAIFLLKFTDAGVREWSTNIGDKTYVSNCGGGFNVQPSGCGDGKIIQFGTVTSNAIATLPLINPGNNAYYSGSGDAGATTDDFIVEFNGNSSSIPTVTVPTEVCSGQTVTLTASGGSTPYTWYNSQTATTSIATGATFSPVINSDTTFYITSGVETANCPLTRTPISIRKISGTASMTSSGTCGNINVTLTLTNYTGTIQWQSSIDGGTTWTNIAGATVSPYTVNAISQSTKFRAVITGTSCTDNSNVMDLTQSPSVTPTVAISGAPTAAICATATMPTYTATITNGGTAPTYQWQINGTNVAGATASTFTPTGLSNGDIVSVNIVSNDPCATTAAASASAAAVTVSQSVTPTVAISGAPTAAICATATMPTYTATISNGGTAPTYQWQINGTNVAGATASTFTPTGLSNGDIVSVNIVSNDPCATTAAASATAAAVTVSQSVTPTVTISGAPTAAICASATMPTYTATISNGGTAPTYQWQINGTNVAGATASTFTPTGLSNGDIVSVNIVSNDPCATTTAASATAAAVTVSPSVTPTVTISGAPTSAICATATMPTYTATITNGGTAPTYQWQINGTNVAGATASTFTPTGLSNGDIVSVNIVSNDPCAITAVASASAAAVTVSQSVTPTVAISGAPTSGICATATMPTYTATISNGGTAPTYQWQINGTNVAGATASTFTPTSLANGDIVSVNIVSNDPCATTTAASATAASVTVSPSVTPTVTISGAPTGAICATATPPTFTAVVTNGGTAPTYQWQANGMDIPGATGLSYTPPQIAAGVEISVKVVSNDPCATTAPVTASTGMIQVTPSVTPTVIISGAPTSAICATATPPTFTAVVTNGGTAPTYQWQANGMDIPGATGSSYTPPQIAAGVEISVKVISNDPCATTQPVSATTGVINVSNSITPTVTISGITNGSVCSGATTTLVANVQNGASNSTYQWQLNGVNIPGATSPTYTSSSINNGDVFTVIVSTTEACYNNATATTGSINTSNGLNVAIQEVKPTCGESDGSLTAVVNGGSGVYTYNWSPVNGTNSQITNVPVGTYTLTVQDNQGCSGTAQHVLTSNGGVPLTVTASATTITEGGSVNLNVSTTPYIAGTTYSWTPANTLSCADCPYPVATPTQTTDYVVTVTTPQGCSSDTTIRIVVNKKCGEVYIPNIFSPNEDGENDVFRVEGVCIAKLKMNIYDRWGERVFETDDKTEGWDGTHRGKVMNTGVFAYVIHVTLLDNTTHEFSGSVTLVR